MPNGKDPKRRDRFLRHGASLLGPGRPAKNLQRIRGNLTAQIPGFGEAALAQELGISSGQPSLDVLFKLTNSLLGSIGLGPEVEVEEEQFGPGVPGRAVDVTAPGVDPGDVKLSPLEKRVRALRRFGAGLRQFIPGPLLEEDDVGQAPTTGQAVELGALAPPRTDADKLIDFMADLFPSIIGGGTAFIGGRLATLGGVQALARAPAGQRLLLRGAEFVAKHAPGARKALTVGQMQARIAAAERVIPQFLADAGGELFAGVALGAGEELRRQATDTKTDYSQIAMGAMFGLGFGATLGTGINLGINAFRFVKAARGMQAMLHSGIVDPRILAPEGVNIRLRGLQVGSKRAVSYKSDGSIQWVDAKGKFTSEPTPEEYRIWSSRLIEDFHASKSEAESVVGKSKQANVDEALEQPGQFLSSFQDRTIQAYEAQYMPTAIGQRTRFKDAAPDILNNQADLLEMWSLQARISDQARLAALGQARAMRRAAGVETPSVPGVTLDEEAAIQNIVKTFPKADAQEMAAREAARGNTAFAARLAELNKLGIPDPAVPAREISAFLDAVNVNTTKGVTRGTSVMLENGTIGEVVQARFGKVSVKFNDPKLAPQVLDIADVVPVPGEGRIVQLKNGQVGRITEVHIADRKAHFKPPKAKKAQVIDFDDIELYGHSQRVKLELEDAEKAARTGATEPKVRTATRARKVDKRTGEPVVVERVGESTSEVMGRGGKRRTMKNKDLGESSRVSRAKEEEGLPRPQASEEVVAREAIVRRLAAEAGVELPKPVGDMTGDEIRELIKRTRC